MQRAANNPGAEEGENNEDGDRKHEDSKQKTNETVYSFFKCSLKILVNCVII